MHFFPYHDLTILKFQQMYYLGNYHLLNKIYRENHFKKPCLNLHFVATLNAVLVFGAAAPHVCVKLHTR